MISIYDSRTVRSSSTTQQILNDLAIYGSGFFVVEPSGGGDVEKLWISDRIYITKASTAYLKIVNEVDSETNISVEGSSSNYFSKFLIVTTDDCLLLRRADLSSGSSFEYRTFIAIGKTTDRSGTVSKGLFCKLVNTTSSLYMFTDNMSTDAASNKYDYDNTAKSTVITSLIKPYSLTSDECFTDLLFAWISKPSDEEKVIMNDQKYYMFGAVALPYT